VGVLLGNENAVFLIVLATGLHSGETAVTGDIAVTKVAKAGGLVSGF
jgi:hypothetical protein